MYIVDVTFDHDYGDLIITFSSVVDYDQSINCNQQEFVYQNRLVNPTAVVVPVYPGECYSYDTGTTVHFRLDHYDYFRILNTTNLFRSTDTAFLRWSDQIGRTLNITAGIHPVEVTPDTDGPYLESFDLDLSKNILTLLFDSPIDIDTLNLGEITLQNDYSPNASYILTGGSVLSGGGNTVCIQLTVVDSTFLKNQQAICKDQELCYVNVANSVVEDLWGNLVIATTTKVSDNNIIVGDMHA